MNIFKHRKTTGEEASPVINQQPDENVIENKPVSKIIPFTSYPPISDVFNPVCILKYDNNIGDEGAFVARFSCKLGDFVNSEYKFKLDNNNVMIDNIPDEMHAVCKKAGKLSLDKDYSIGIDFTGNPENASFTYMHSTNYGECVRFRFDESNINMYLDFSTMVNISICNYIDCCSYDLIITPLNTNLKSTTLRYIM